MNKELVTVRDIAEAIGTTPQNIRQSYKSRQDKEKFYEILMLGTFIKKHKIDIEEVIKIHTAIKAVEHGN